ncbi:hypothetical protein BCV72DRAFT_196921, partial [Rhizopus microsporus var. microsporus]
ILYEDGYGNGIDNNGGSELMNYIDKTIAIYSEYLKTVAFNGSSLSCPISIEKPKDEDICMKEARFFD